MRFFKVIIASGDNTTEEDIRETLQHHDGETEFDVGEDKVIVPCVEEVSWIIMEGLHPETTNWYKKNQDQ